MSKIAFSPNDSGTGTFTIESPPTNDNRTLELPDVSGNLIADRFGAPSYRYVTTLYFESSGTFEKTSYPWLQAVRVKMVGGGGGSSGAQETSSTQASIGAGGNGGNYAESFILSDVLGGSESVTVGAGGAGAPVTDPEDAQDGGSSSFGSLVQAAGGLAGTSTSTGNATGTASTVFQTLDNTFGDFIRIGETSGRGVRNAASGGAGKWGLSTHGGASALGFGGRASTAANTRLSARQGDKYGGGASGAVNLDGQPAAEGGDGGDGIVIVELYA